MKSPRYLVGALVAGLFATLSACVQDEAPITEDDSELISLIDFRLRRSLSRSQVSPVTPPDAQDPNLVSLGQNLFFDKELSGRRNIACATCHHPFLGTGDGQSQSRAQGAVGLGQARRHGPRSEFLPRNTLTLWNRGVPDWTVMFWDGRLFGTREEGFVSPAGDATPQTFDNALAAFVSIPITPGIEMRGFPGELDVFGQVNELEPLNDSDFELIWEGVVRRVLAIDEYRQGFVNAFPGVAEEDIDIVHLSNAVGAFMTDAFTALDSPFDRYLAGDNRAMSTSAKRGALLFYGRANCANCHAGGLQTDFDFHNIAAPQVGTGNGDEAPLDFGRGRVTNVVEDNFKFRTPSLRNVSHNGPWFHNGAYATLEAAVQHHLDPASALANYDDSQVEPELFGTFVDDPAVTQTLLDTVDPALAVSGSSLSEREVSDIVAFLNALTDPSTVNLFNVIPNEVPSGLPLAD